MSRELEKDNNDSLYCALLLTRKSEYPLYVRLANGDEINGLDSPDEIYSMIWEPIIGEAKKNQMNIKNIYFSPVGHLHCLPIENALSFKNKKINAFRMSSTRYLCKTATRHTAKTGALFGGMWYNVDNPPTSEIDDDQRYPYLPFTLDEVCEVKKMLKGWNDTTYIGRSATEENFKALSEKSAAVILLSTHGIYSEEKGDAEDAMNKTAMLMSGVENKLSKELTKGEEDGFLYATEIEDLNLSGTDLVMLSGCKTAKGTVNSDGVFGLQRGFKRAGVNTVIMSINDVNDEAAQLFVTNFFKPVGGIK